MTRLKVGVLGGTFDPVHLAHLIIAEDVRQKLALEEVLFVPAGQPWLKGGEATPAEHRLEMVVQAIASNPYFTVSTVDLDRPGPTYSVDTLSELRAGLGTGARIYFIVGLDALKEFPGWRSPRRVIELCQIVAVKRPGYGALEKSWVESAVPGAADRVITVDVPQIDISATEIRKRVSRGLSIKYLVPESVEHYIAEHGLYTEGG